MKKCITYGLLLATLACSHHKEVATQENYEAITLPDGSQVYMNHQSAISFEEDFDPRRVKLSGEAFFVVKPGESTFTVVTDHGHVMVLGTCSLPLFRTLLNS